MDIQGRSMSVTAVCNQLFCHIQSSFEIRCLVKRQYRGKFLMCERFRHVYGGNFADQDLGISRYGKACDLCDGCSLLAYNLRINGSCLGQDDLANLIQFVLVQNMAAALKELGSHCRIDICDRRYRLFRRTDHTIIKRLGMDHRINCCLNITAAVHDNRYISRTNADCWIAGRISRLHHAGASGCQNHVYRFHNQVGQLDRRLIYPSDDTFRSACLYSCLKNNLRRFNCTFLRTRMRADDDCIPGLQTDETFEDCSRSRVRGRNDRSHKAYRFRDLLDAKSLILFDHADCLNLLIRIVHILSRIVILDDLVFHNTHSGLFTGHLRKRNTLFIRSHGSLKEDLVDLLSRESSKYFLRLSHRSDLFLEQLHLSLRFRCIFSFLFCHKYPPSIAFIFDIPEYPW